MINYNNNTKNNRKMYNKQCDEYSYWLNMHPVLLNLMSEIIYQQNTQKIILYSSQFIIFYIFDKTDGSVSWWRKDGLALKQKRGIEIHYNVQYTLTNPTKSYFYFMMWKSSFFNFSFKFPFFIAFYGHDFVYFFIITKWKKPYCATLYSCKYPQWWYHV